MNNTEAAIALAKSLGLGYLQEYVQQPAMPPEFIAVYGDTTFEVVPIHHFTDRELDTAKLRLSNPPDEVCELYHFNDGNYRRVSRQEAVTMLKRCGSDLP